jgi:inward rectifier potassium channel
VHDIRSYAPKDIRFGMRYADVVPMAEDGTPVADIARMGELEPDVGDRPEPGWTEREGELE